MLLASCAGSLESVKLLLTAGASPKRRSLRGPDGRTAAQAARTAGHEECVLSIEWHEQRAASAHAAAGEKEEVAVRKLAEAVQGGNLAALEECIAKYGSAASADALFSASNARDRLRRESTDSAELALSAAQANAETQLERLKPLNEAGAAAASEEAEASLVALRRAIAELAEQPEPTGTGADRLREARALRTKLANEVSKATKREKLHQQREQKRREEAAAAAEVVAEAAMATAMATARREAEELRRANEQQKSLAGAIAAAEVTAAAEAADGAGAVAAVADAASAAAAAEAFAAPAPVPAPAPAPALVPAPAPSPAPATKIPAAASLGLQGLQASMVEDYHCPITTELMADPVMTTDGFTYERAAIERWFVSSNLSPITGMPLASTQLVPNLTAQSGIRAVLERHTPAQAAAHVVGGGRGGRGGRGRGGRGTGRLPSAA